MPAVNSHSFALSVPEQQRLEELLRTGNYLLHEVPHARVAAKTEGCTIVLYQSGKCVVQGKGGADWVQFHLEPEVLQRVVLPDPSIAAETDDALFAPHIGIDESGKGDFFGPLVIAAVYVEPGVQRDFAQWGIRDSKQIKSDDRIAAIAQKVRGHPKIRYEEVFLPPPTYNRLIARMGSVNRLLAWGHAKALESLLERVPTCTRAVADQFGPEHQIRSALKAKGRSITLEQRHKAESDPAVAAASILARDRFVRGLAELGKPYELQFPKGATVVRPAAEALVRQHGPAALASVVKLHFRTTQQVLEACGLDRSNLPDQT